MTNKKRQSTKSKPDVGTLIGDPVYSLNLELDFNDMIPFVLSNIRRRSVFSVLYFFINTATLLFMLFYILWAVALGHLNAWKILWQLFAGIICGSILVIPPHEMLHGLAYRMLGARKIRFGADLKQFIFYVTADRFPISKKELAFLALTPFVLINVVLIGIVLGWASQLTLFFTALLLSHNIMCIGDFAMIAFAYHHKGKIFTFDDIEKKKSYFFEKTGHSY